MFVAIFITLLTFLSAEEQCVYSSGSEFYLVLVDFMVSQDIWPTDCVKHDDKLYCPGIRILNLTRILDGKKDKRSVYYHIVTYEGKTTDSHYVIDRDIPCWNCRDCHSSKCKACQLRIEIVPPAIVCFDTYVTQYSYQY